MVKVDRIPETSDSKSDVIKGYMNIKPVESMSDQETSDFIASEFEKAHDDAEIDTYDKLISEVFNRFEDELDIDFEINDKLSAILEKFKADEWKTLDVADKLPVIKEFVNALGKELGLDKIPDILLADDEDDAYGFFDARNNSIVLNSNFFSDASELVNTIAHEVRHAYQHMRADILDTWEDALYKVNFDNYISPIPLPEGGWLFFTDYLHQYVEVDARAFASIFTEAIR